MSSGVARFVGTFAVNDEVLRLMHSDTLELYHVDPPLRGYQIVAAGQGIWAVNAVAMGQPMPDIPEDAVRTTVFGTTGGEGLKIVWRDPLLVRGGRVPVRALEELGYRVLR